MVSWADPGCSVLFLADLCVLLWELDTLSLMRGMGKKVCALVHRGTVWLQLTIMSSKKVRNLFKFGRAKSQSTTDVSLNNFL